MSDEQQQEQPKRYAIMHDLSVVEVIKVRAKTIKTRDGIFRFSQIAVLDPTEQQLMTANVMRQNFRADLRALEAKKQERRKAFFEEARSLIIEWQNA